MRAVLVRSSIAPTLVTVSSAVTATMYAAPSAMICAPPLSAQASVRSHGVSAALTCMAYIIWTDTLLQTLLMVQALP